MRHFVYSVLTTASISMSACSTSKTSDEGNGTPVSFDGTAANFDGTWVGLCKYIDIETSRSFDGDSEVIVKQAAANIEVRGACYSKKPLGQYFLTKLLTIAGNDLLDSDTQKVVGRIGSNALTFRRSAVAGGNAIVSNLEMKQKSASELDFEFLQDATSTEPPSTTRLSTMTGSAKK